MKSFSGATIEDVYARPSLRRKPDLIILHCGTNNLRETKPANEIADDVIKLATEIKSDENNVMVNGLTTDNLQEKSQKVNDILKIKSAQLGIYFIDNSNFKQHHFNPKGIYLNFNGSEALARNFISSIKT